MKIDKRLSAFFGLAAKPTCKHFTLFIYFKAPRVSKGHENEESADPCSEDRYHRPSHQANQAKSICTCSFCLRILRIFRISFAIWILWYLLSCTLGCSCSFQFQLRRLHILAWVEGDGRCEYLPSADESLFLCRNLKSMSCSWRTEQKVGAATSWGRNCFDASVHHQCLSCTFQTTCTKSLPALTRDKP